MTTYLLEKDEDFDASDFQRYFSEIFEERGFEVHFPGVEFQELLEAALKALVALEIIKDVKITA